MSKSLIDIGYLKIFWERIKGIVTTSQFELNKKTQTVKESIDELGEEFSFLKKALSIREITTSGPTIIDKSGVYTYKRAIKPINSTTFIEWSVTDENGVPLDTNGLLAINTDPDNIDDNGLLTALHGYEGVVKIQAKDKISELVSSVTVNVDTTLPDPIWTFESNATSNLPTGTTSSGIDIASQNGLGTWLLCVSMTKTTGLTTNIGLAAGSASYNNSTGVTLLSRNRATQFDVRVFGTNVATQQATYKIYVKRNNGVIEYSTDGQTWTIVANPTYATGTDGVLRFINNAATNYQAKVELYDDLSNNAKVIERFNK